MLLIITNCIVFINLKVSKGLFIGRRVTWLTELLALPGQTIALFIWNRVTRHSYVQYTVLHEVPQSSGKHACAVGKSSSRLAEFPRQSIYMVKYSSRLGEIPPLSTRNSPRQVTRLRHVNISPGNL